MSGTKALIGLLAMSFMATYMLMAPVFGWMAERGFEFAFMAPMRLRP